MARIDFAPGVDNADHRLAGEIFAAVANLFQARTVRESGAFSGTNQRWLRRSSGLRLDICKHAVYSPVRFVELFRAGC
jgi:hypothetical protein